MKRLIAGLGLGAALTFTSCCVARGTRVATPRGPRRVEDLEVGDEVIVVDPETFATSTSRLVAMKDSQRECGTLSHAGGRLCVTTDHPIFDPDARGFFPAGDWLTGARSALLISDEKGVRREAIRDVQIFTRVDDVFDLTVEHEWHTFVAEGVVVHNKAPLCGPSQGEGGSCRCDAGTGILMCQKDPYKVVTCQCSIPSGGTNGGFDGGASDGGFDGGSEDAGAEDGGDGG